MYKKMDGCVITQALVLSKSVSCRRVSQLLAHMAVPHILTALRQNFLITLIIAIKTQVDVVPT